MGKDALTTRWARLGRRRGLLIEAVIAVTAACAAVRFLPFRLAVRLGSRRLAINGDTHGAELTPDICWSVETTARILPWRAVCFQKGLALQWMLRRRGVDAELHYGLGIIGSELKAHVWIAAGETIFMGGEEAQKFKRVGRYP